jgi:hypothetical protein
MKAQWGDTEAEVTTVEDLDSVVRAVEKTKQPTMVFLGAENGRVLVFGVGHNESVLTFFEPDGTSFHSLGDINRKGHFIFLCRDRVDEFMQEMAVPTADAITAAKQFLANGEQPAAVRWEGDW